MKFLEEQDIACLKAGYSFDGEKAAFVCPVCGESFDAEMCIRDRPIPRAGQFLRPLLHYSRCMFQEQSKFTE